MNAYSKGLRLKVLETLDRGVPREEVVALFGVSLSSVKRWRKRRRENGGLEPLPSPGRTPTIGKTDEERRALWAQLEADDDATLERHCELWEEGRGARVSVSTMSRAVRKLGWTRKKDAGSLRARRGGQERLAGAPLRGVDPRRLVFVDECSTNVALTTRYARAPEGERAYGKAPRNWARTSLISSLSLEDGRSGRR